MKTGEIIESFLFLVFTVPVYGILRSFSECHEDFVLNPKDGVLPPYTFNWMGVIQYVHVVTGKPIIYKAPRVVLIHRHFVIAASRDVKYIPVGHKLGHVVIDDYERLESDCQLTEEQIVNEEKCPRAVIEMPISNVIFHPEHISFRVEHSLALVKLAAPVKSPYVLPICLPSTEERRRQAEVKEVFLVDYVNLVPLNYDFEKKAKKTYKLLDEERCLSIRSNLTILRDESILQVLCTSGCGFRSGSPLVTHNPDGPFEIVGLAVGGGSCKNNRMRNKVTSDPPIFVDVYPYRKWIINVITANLIPSSIPNIIATDRGRRQSLSTAFYSRSQQRQGWRGRWFVVGDACYKHVPDNKKEINIFYHDVVQIKPPNNTNVNYFIQLSAGYETVILCAKILMPLRKISPVVTGLGTYKINITLNTKWFPVRYNLEVGLYGKTSSEQDRQKWRLEMVKDSMYWSKKYPK